MERRDLEQIDAFLGMVGKTTLFEYYEVDPSAPNDDVEAAARQRRSWAQGQQANPKYRNEALWLIKHNALVRRILLEQREDYLAEVNNRTQAEKLTVLSTFIEGVLTTGVLTRKAEELILKQGQSHGLSDEAIIGRIDELLIDTGAQREVDPDDVLSASSTAAEFIDFYLLLDVDPEATWEVIELAHRAKYKWARNLKDKERVTVIYSELDAAWRILKDPVKRATYDASRRARQMGFAIEAETEILGFIGGTVSEPTAPTEPIGGPPPTQTPTLKSDPRPSMAPPVRPSSNTHEGELPSSAPTLPPALSAPPKPPPVPGIGTRTLGTGQHVKPARRNPRLAIASPELVVIKVGRKAVVHKIIVKNAGKGKMPGRATSDRSWLTIKSARLDPDAHQQEVEVVIQPADMPRSKGVALVTVVTDHGERRAITLRVERQSPQVAMIAGAVVLGLLLVVALASLMGFLGGGDPPPAPSGSSLRIQVDPNADAITLNGEVVGKGQELVLTEGFELGEPLRVGASLDGFSPAERTVVVEEGAPAEVSLSLDMNGEVAGPPPEGTPVVKVNAEVAAKAIRKQNPQIEACLRDELSGQPGLRAELVLNIFINSVGTLTGVEIKSYNYEENPAVLPCVYRQLRAVKFPMVAGGEIGGVYNHVFEATVTSGSG